MNLLQILTDTTTSIIITLIIKIVGFLVTVFYLIRKQAESIGERLQDGLEVLRWAIMLFLVVSLILNAPAAAYQVLRLLGEDSTVLRAIGTITSNLSDLTVLAALVFTFSYKRRGGDTNSEEDKSTFWQKIKNLWRK